MELGNASCEEATGMTGKGLRNRGAEKDRAGEVESGE